MNEATVQFRFLQVVTNHLADERVTVGLLHFDGAELRVAINPARVPDLPSKSDVSSLVRSLRTTILAQVTQPALSLSLDALSPVQLGETGLLSWGVLRVGQTTHPQAHFEYLAKSLGLHPKPQRQSTRVEHAFAAHAEQLARSINRPDIVQANRKLHGLAEHESPLSWKNGVWHHTFPVAADASDPKGFLRKMTSTLGRIDATVPAGSVGVVVAAFRGSPAAANESAGRASDHIRTNLCGRVELVQAQVTAQGTDFSALDERVRADIVRHVDVM